MKSFTRKLTLALCGSLLVAASACGQGPVFAVPEAQPAAAQSAQQSLGDLGQLLAPIALYPDELVGQILTASTYPTEVVEASRWMQRHPGLEGQALADAVDQQPWDPSVKALTEFPAVLDSMNENLSWTSALGDAYVNQPQDVMSVVQAMRKRAKASGTLKSTSQQSVGIENDDTIVIEPANPEVVYVPAYDPWLVYGAPIVALPGWYPVPGIFWGGVGLSFGIGFGIGIFGGFGWGWGHWGYDWHGRRAFFDHHEWVSHSRDFGHDGFHHGDFSHGHGDFGRGNFGRGNPGRGGFDHGSGFHEAPGFHGSSGTQFRGFWGGGHRGKPRGFSSRGWG